MLYQYCYVKKEDPINLLLDFAEGHYYTQIRVTTVIKQLSSYDRFT